MNRILRKIILTILFIVLPTICLSQGSVDSITVAQSLEQLNAAVRHKSVLTRLIDYYSGSNKDNTKKFDMTLFVGPYYSKDTRLGIGGGAVGLYRPNLKDTISPISDLNLTARISLTGFYKFQVDGNHNSNKDNIRIHYDFYFRSLPINFWGTGFKHGDSDISTEYVKKTFSATVQPSFKLAKHLYVGPVGSYNWTMGHKFECDSIFPEYNNDISNSLALGAHITYDSRDFTYNAYKGIYVKVEQRNYINFGDQPFFKTIADFRGYSKVWRGGILASRIYGEFSYGNTPWTMKAQGDGATVLRGYSEGRYADDNMIMVTLELRQRIWRRIGMVVWAGAANLYSKNEGFDWDHTLPDLGAGLRYELKKRINLRLDCGFGRCGEFGFIFGMQEVF